jgi:hypothetical protein
MIILFLSIIDEDSTMITILKNGQILFSQNDLNISNKPSKKDWSRLYKNESYLILNPNFIWDENTKDELIMPCLEWISVPLKDREKGIGETLFLMLRKYQLDNNIPMIWGQNYNKSFWKHMMKKYKFITCNKFNILEIKGEI